MCIDLNRTHARNPDWPRHARFHLVWQDVTIFLLAGFEAGLVWWRGPLAEQRFYFVAALTAIPLLAFLAALLGRRWYGGALSDPNGIPPAKLILRGGTTHLDLNLAAVAAALLVLAVLLSIHA